MAHKKELIRNVLQSIRDNPQEHNQRFWFDELDGGITEDRTLTAQDFADGNACGTTACIAGWITLHDGWSYKVIKGEDSYGPLISHTLVKGDEFRDPDEAPYIAEAALGLERDDEDFDLNLGQIFYDLDNKRAIAQLMYYYKNGELPRQETCHSSGFPILEIAGVPENDFVKKWYDEKFLTEFTPTKIEAKQ